jgi:hypothetical protein
MIFTFDKKTREIEVCKKTNFSTHAILERKHLERWIEVNPEILCEDLLVITNEYYKFDKTNERLDLLAIDREGNIVVIELKRDDSGKNVDLQAIRYAAYCSTLTLEMASNIYKNYLEKSIANVSKEDARNRIVEFITNSDFEEINDKPRIILVSKEFRPEVTASVLWLRKFGLDIKCIKLSPFEVTADKIGIEVNTIIPIPEAEDYIIQAERKENQEGIISVSRQEYLQFYAEIVKRLSSQISKTLRPPDPQSYYQIPTGISGTHFEWGFHGRPRSSFGVELHCERGDSNFNRGILKKLTVHQDLLQRELAENVIFQERWGQKWSRIYVEYPHGEINDELKNWAVEKMKIFINILQPEIDKLKA